MINTVAMKRHLSSNNSAACHARVSATQTLAALLSAALVALTGCRHAGPASAPAKAPQPQLAAWVAPYRATAEKIIRAATRSDRAYQALAELCDDIGHRISGSPQLDQAIAWAEKRLKADGQENVRSEPVQVRQWIRGAESLQMTAPHQAELPMLGLGGSVGTAKEGVSAKVVVVDSDKALARLADKATDKIVLFNVPMPPYHPEHGSGYGKVVRYRYDAARLAADAGAVAALVRSATTRSLRTPHTGAMSYEKAKKKIPAAAITIEDAEMLARLYRRGIEPTLTLRMDARDGGMVPSANVIAELRGSTHPEQVVVIGGHIDSWDVGQGAHDDGAGVVMAMEALNVLRQLGLRPKRTVRVVLWTNEENGLGGAKAYAATHAAELNNHVAAIEADQGGFPPRGFAVAHDKKTAQELSLGRVRQLLALLDSIGARRVEPSTYGGADIWPMKKSQVPLLGLLVHAEHYFDFHHTPADTLDKVDPAALAKGVATLATMAYVLAEMPGRLDDEQ